jgi:glucan phosphoethanolaminetransferase (alkaline phosphatase superfamily)
MIINNKEISARIRLGFMMYVLVYMVLLVLSLVLKWSPKHIFEIVSSIIFVLGVIYFVIMRFYYIYFNNEGLKIILRYMILQPLSHGNYSIEIAKRDFSRYEIKSRYFGLQKSLILYAKTPQGEAKYKPVSLSSLRKREFEALIQSLEINLS